MIAKSPDNRYQTAREVADAFGAWLAQHAGDDWKEKHREIADVSASRGSHEPTRAKSAATEDTDLELDIAPTEIRAAATDLGSDAGLGLDQLEELDPAATSVSTGSSSSGLDDLLSEALDNYPAFDSNPDLAVSSLQESARSWFSWSGKAQARRRVRRKSDSNVQTDSDWPCG